MDKHEKSVGDQKIILGCSLIILKMELVKGVLIVDAKDYRYD